jgi:hypothetical protein
LREELALRRADEINASRILALPAAERPRDPLAVHAWILDDLRIRGDHELANYLAEDLYPVTIDIMDFIEKYDLALAKLAEPEAA